VGKIKRFEAAIFLGGISEPKRTSTRQRGRYFERISSHIGIFTVLQETLAVRLVLDLQCKGQMT